MDDFILENCKYVDTINQTATHYHTACELIFVNRGSICIQIDNKSYQVGDNKIIVISNLEKHETRILSSTYERYFIIFSQKKLERYLDSPELISIFKNRPIAFSHCFEAPKDAEDIFQSIIKENENRDAFSEDIIAMKVKLLLIQLYRVQPFPFTNTNTQKQIHAIQKYIAENFRSEIKISDLSAKFFINECYLSHTFKRLTGYSPKKYLMANRLAHAKHLLVHSCITINEVATQSGFSDSNSFIRSFKKEFDMTPNEYRRGKFPLVIKE